MTLFKYIAMVIVIDSKSVIYINIIYWHPIWINNMVLQ